jgi:hypothetical protein
MLLPSPRRIETIPEAKAIQQAARQARAKLALHRKPKAAEHWRPQNRKPVGENRLTPVGEMPTENANGPVR